MAFVAIPARAPVYKARPKPEEWRAIRHAAERREPVMRRELLQAFADLRDALDTFSATDRLEQACATGRVQAVLDAIPFEALRPGMIHAIAVLNDALVEGGAVAGRQLVDRLFPVKKIGNVIAVDFAKKKEGRAKFEVRFDLTNPEAVKWASANSGRLVTQITNDTKAGVQALVVRAFEQGIPPRDLAKLIQQQGIGLTAPQAIALSNFRNRLIADGVKPDRIQLLTQRKYDQQIKYRSHVIARHELLTASNKGQSLLWQQSVGAGLLPETTKRKWIITPDDRLCPLCAEMRGERAITGLKEPWSTPKGEVTTPQQIHVQCRCAQGLVIDLKAAQAEAQAAIANPNEQLKALMPKLVEPHGATIPPGMMTPKPATLTEGQMQTIWSLASSGKAKLPAIASGMRLDPKLVADAYRTMATRQATILAELKARAPQWPIADDVQRTIGSKYPEAVSRHGAKWKRTLAARESEAIRSYTGSGYQTMNEYLRNGGSINGDEWAAQSSKAVQTALMNAPQPPPPELVWRGVSRWPEEFTAGSVQRFKGFQSTTIDPKFAEGWSSTLLEIKPKRGAYIQPLSMHKAEMEYLLPHNAEFKVIGRRRVKFKDRYGNVYERDVVQLEQVD